MVNKWIQGARPRTLPAAVVPVVVGLAVAIGVEGAQWLRGGLALVVSLLLQVGVNYANDYSDGVRGTDEVRVGPQRLVGSGLATPRSVKLAAFLCFGLAAVVGLALALMTSLWVIPVGLAAVLAGWFYTGGKNPYGYIGLGEVFVFVFFRLGRNGRNHVRHFGKDSGNGMATRNCYWMFGVCVIGNQQSS